MTTTSLMSKVVFHSRAYPSFAPFVDCRRYYRGYRETFVPKLRHKLPRFLHVKLFPSTTASATWGDKQVSPLHSKKATLGKVCQVYQANDRREAAITLTEPAALCLNPSQTLFSHQDSQGSRTHGSVDGTALIGVCDKMSPTQQNGRFPEVTSVRPVHRSALSHS